MSLKTVLIQDARIAGITSEEHFAVMDGASQSTFQNFACTTQSSSSIVWNIQIPSENVVIDRHLLMQSTVTLTLNLSGPDGNGISNVDVIGTGTTTNPQYPSEDNLVFDYGLTDSLQAFPLNALCVSQQMSINNCTISQNTKDILPMILRMSDTRALNKLNSACPSLVDAYYCDFNSGLGCMNNALASYNNAILDTSYVPRGAFDLQIKSVIHTYYDSVNGNQTNNSLVMLANTTNNKFTIVVQFTTTEPFVALSPWLNTSQSNHMGGLIGVNNISCNLNIDGTCSRVWSTMGKNYFTSISLGGTVNGTSVPPFQNSKLLMNFLSLQPEQYKKMSSKCVIPYNDYPRFLTSQSSQSPVIAGGTSTLTSNSLQLNQIPDLILISVRKPMSTQDWNDPNYFLTITGISISFNNTSGILATANANQLYNISVRNGSSQNYYEFSGYANNNNTGSINSDGQITLAPADANSAGKPVQVGTTGSMLVLNPSYDFNLPSYLSASSLGQYNLYFTIAVLNQTAYDIVPEICVVTVNSGLFTTQLGSSIINTGVLDKQTVLQCKDQKTNMVDSNQYKRFIGGMLNNIGSSNVMKLFKKHVNVSDDNKPEEAIIENGSGISGGRISRLKKHLR